MIDLKTGTLLPHDRALLVHKAVTDRISNRPEAECPLWENTLDKI